MQFIILFIVFILLVVANKKQHRPGYIRKTHLMTPTEYRFYLMLCDHLKHTDYKVFSKVRLLDLVQPEDEANKEAFLKVASKHIDFVICSPDTGILCAIELNDSSHEQADRIARDKFVLQVFADVGLPFVAFPVCRQYNFSELTFLHKTKAG